MTIRSNKIQRLRALVELAGIKELAALPPNAHERVVAKQLLLELRHSLGQQPSQTPKEQKFMVAMHKAWKDARAKGRAEGHADAVLTALRVRRIAVPEATRKRILARKICSYWSVGSKGPSSPHRSER